jgi:hypothetical protein
MADQRNSWNYRFLLIASGLVLGALALLIAVAVPSARMEIHRARTMNNLHHIWSALHVYSGINGCYPPQYLTDAHGKPVHSWRVLVLPMMGYKDLYERYRFDEPWDGPHNKLLASEMPEEYRSPFSRPTSAITQYVAIVGKRTAWQGTTPLRGADIGPNIDGCGVVFVEAANSDVNWMEPRDIPIEQAMVGIDVGGGGGIRSNYPDGLPTETIWSGVRWVPSETPLEVYRAMLKVTRD